MESRLDKYESFIDANRMNVALWWEQFTDLLGTLQSESESDPSLACERGVMSLLRLQLTISRP